MSQPTVDRSEEELAEIERHKYFLSEKAGYDVGWDAAEVDWESKYGASFRRDHGIDTGSESSGIGTFFRRLLAK